MVFASTLLFALTSLPVHAQTPVVTNGTPAESFAGEQFCFDIGWDNVGTPGFGPYHRLILPPEISLDSATYLGLGITTTAVGTFPAAPGNQLTDPRTGSVVTGPEGNTLILLILPLGSVVTNGPTIVTKVCATISTTAAVGSSLDVTVQPVYEFGDTATGANGPIVGAEAPKSVTPTIVTITKNQDVAEDDRVPGPLFEFTYTLTVNVANG